MLKKIMVPLLSCVIFSGFAGCGGDDLSEGSICSNWCKLAERCEPEFFYEEYSSVSECRADCVGEFDYLKNHEQMTRECYSALKKLYNCVSKLSCGELYDYYDEPYADYPCAKYDRDADRFCSGEGRN